jgi:hypothetical protein
MQNAASGITARKPIPARRRLRSATTGAITKLIANKDQPILLSHSKNKPAVSLEGIPKLAMADMANAPITRATVAAAQLNASFHTERFAACDSFATPILRYITLSDLQS